MGKEKKGRNRRSSDTLRMASDHLNYEFWMLGEALNKIKSINQQKQTASMYQIPKIQIETNLAIESFAVHARCLNDFFFNKAMKQEDMIANDYLDEIQQKTWREYILQHQHHYEYTRKRVIKEIVHLTYDRTKIDPDEKMWDLQKGHKIFSEIMLKFLNLVDTGKICDRLEMLTT